MRFRTIMRVRTFSKFSFAIALCLAVIRPAEALDPAKAFTQYAVSSWAHANGLEPKSIMSVAQTNDGFLWLATEQGLVRYDGITFTTFDERNAPALGDRLIRSLAADADGSLWIGTMTGLSRYADGVFQDLRGKTQWHTDIYDLCVDGDGGVWFSSDFGLHHFGKGANRVYTTADGLPSNGITGLARGADGRLWVGTIVALASFQSGHFTIYNEWAAFRNNAINAVATGAQGVVWIGMRDGTIGRWANGKVSTWWNGAETRGKRIECLHEDREGSLWIAVKKLGLGRLRGRNLSVLTTANNLPSNSPDWIFEDRENSLWIGWADAGVSMLRDTKFITFGKAEGLSSDNISSVTGAANGGLWIGTGDAGIDHLKDGHVRVMTKADGLARNEVLGLLEQRDGTLWVGSENGQVTRIRNTKSTILPVSSTFSPGIPAIAEDRHGVPWFALDMPGGLSTYQDGRFKQMSPVGVPRSIAFAPDGSLWVSSYLFGLTRFKNGVSHTYTERDGLPSLALTSVYVDRTGVVWVGTALAGIARWKEGKITAYSTKDGLFDNAVGGMMEDGYGYMWMAGSRGIWRTPMQDLDDLADGRAGSVHNEVYGYAEGLRSIETSFAAQPALWKGEDGRLWFATGGGLSVIDPGRILVNRIAPQVVIEGLLFDGNQALRLPDVHRQSGAFKLPPGEGNVQIGFTAASFVAAEKMQFRYRLNGTSDWVKTTGRTASYLHLSPGNYHFEVQAANNDGVWSTNIAAIDFRIVAHYYQQFWFWTLVAMGFTLAIWQVHMARVRSFLRKTLELEKIVAARTAEVSKALLVAEGAKELLLEQATKDGLTGLWNRRAIFEIFERELSRCKQESQPLCAIMVDADHFKRINDTYGHLVGDLVIQAISEHLKKGLRTNEVVGRYGGEEILILLPRCPMEIGLRRAEELRAAIERSPILYDGKEIRVTCSFGVGQLGEARTPEEIVDEADQALYLAKRDGRNQVRAYASSLPSSELGLELHGPARKAQLSRD